MELTKELFKADLHSHSSCSDGSLTPIELLDLAKAQGLSGFSITDHDTIEAYKSAIPYAQKINLPLIPGIECSSWHEGESVHILGYSFDLTSLPLQRLIQRHAKRRDQRNAEILEKLSRLGMPLTYDEISAFAAHTIGRPHIAQGMLKKGYVSSIDAAFRLYIGEGCKAYAKGDVITAEETIQCIHEAKGLALIAHPHLVYKQALFKALLELPFDGLEGYYSRFSAKDNARFVAIGQHRKWIVTGGSDFHGATKPKVPLGASWTEENTFNLLLKHARASSSS